MSAAQTTIDTLAEATRAEEAEIRKANPSKPRNISRRNVVNLPDELGFFLGGHLDVIGASSVPGAMRILIVEALRARGYTMQEIKLAWKKECVRRAQEDVEAAEAAMAAEALLEAVKDVEAAEAAMAAEQG